MNNMNNQNNRNRQPAQLNDMLNMVSKQLGTTNENLKTQLSGNDVGKLLGKLNPTQLSQVQSIINDKQKLESILNSPQAQALLRNINKG